MTRARRNRRKQRRKRIQGWKGAKPLLERWRKSLTTVAVELKQPRIIDVASFDFVGGEPVVRKGKPMQIFRGQLIYFTNDDVTIRRPSGAVLVVDNYEIVAISDGKTRLEPR
jgi:hypothetical protein